MATLFDSIREPTTSIVFPTEFDPAEDGTILKLAAVGVRKRFMYSAYAFGLYYNESAAKQELARWNTYELDELRCNVSFYNNLVASNFSKAIRLVLARNARGSDLEVAFEGSIRPRIQRIVKKITHGHSKGSSEYVAAILHYCSVWCFVGSLHFGSTNAVHLCTYDRQVISDGLDALVEFRSQFEGLRLVKGTEICLRNEGHTLVTSINGEELARITNHLLCSALFDVFLGDSPISREAKEVCLYARTRVCVCGVLVDLLF
jgi:hypothetical protein